MTIQTTTVAHRRDFISLLRKIFGYPPPGREWRAQQEAASAVSSFSLRSGRYTRSILPRLSGEIGEGV
jgi:hypothetical protein